MMPIISDESDRPGCVPTLKDEPFLPSIKSLSPTKSDKPGRGGTTNHRSSSTSNNNNNKEDHNNSSRDYHHDPHNGRKPSDPYAASMKPYSSAPASEASTPFKLPTIDRTESKSVTSLASDRLGHKRLGRSRDRRSRLCRSPSCPSLAYWAPDNPESPRTARLNDSAEHREVGHPRPFFTHREEDGLKLPSIFNPNKTVNSSFTLTSSTANSSTHTSRDTSPFHFKREDTFLNIPHREHSTDGPQTYTASPQHTCTEGDMSRSSTQSSALLLPISSCHDSRNTGKSKRKRKKTTGLLVSSEVGSEAEKLLREKLGAIERRDFDRSSPTQQREGEKTDLSDTAFIDKVKDETNLANGPSETLATKPPVYQNTPTRIKTEKKVAPVKA